MGAVRSGARLTRARPDLESHVRGRAIEVLLGAVLAGGLTGMFVVQETNFAVDAPIVVGERQPARSVERLLSPDYVTSDAGCLEDRSAQGLDQFFAAAVGPVIGHDSPRILPLGGKRALWIAQDPFVDNAGTAAQMIQAQYMNSAVFVQDGNCFTTVVRGTPETSLSFEPGDGESFDRFFWPAGGSVDGATIKMFWTEMHRDPVPADPLDGVNVHPVATWLATYDLQSLQRLSFVKAPNSGVQPVYGFDVVDDGDYSYLFGNSFAQNLSLEGGYSNGPHTGTKMWLARVPRGQLQRPPEYRTADGWSSVPSDAVAISSRYWTENEMRPVLIGGRWLSVTKVDGFLGNELVVDSAEHPWGPWTQVSARPAAPRGSPDGLVTYAPIPMPWLDRNGELIVGLSQIDIQWPSHNGGDPARYRPHYFDIPLTGGKPLAPAS